VTLAVPLDYVAKVETAGLSASAILPAFSEVCERLGLSEAEAAASVIAHTSFVLDKVLLPSFANSTAQSTHSRKAPMSSLVLFSRSRPEDSVV
jgi:hypothetical protein